VPEATALELQPCEVEIPECLRGKIGYIRLHSQRPGCTYNVTWRVTGWIVDKVQSSIRFLKRNPDDSFEMVTDEEGATRFVNATIAIRALERAIKTLDGELPPLSIDHSEVYLTP